MARNPTNPRTAYRMPEELSKRLGGRWGKVGVVGEELSKRLGGRWGKVGVVGGGRVVGDG